MPVRSRLVWFCALWLFSPPLLARPPVEPSPALRLWEQGQELIRECRYDDAIRCYHQSLRLEPQLTRNYLSLAAAHVGKGEEAQAAPWLGRYVEAEPQHHVIRRHYAELLLRLDRPFDARHHLERFTADIQDREELAAAHLLDCHTRLMELAESMADEYGEHLNRGIGLFLLACQRAQLPDTEDEMSTETLLCKAAAELGLARMHRPEEARPCWYLYEVWSHLGQRHPAARWLRAAESASPFSYLTPAEQRGLHLACQQRDAGRRGK